MTKKRSKGMTINTDASFKDGVGAYAYYINFEGTRLKGGMYLQGTIGDPTEAESKCIGNVFKLLSKLDYLPPIEFIVVNTDSMYSISGIKEGESDLYKKIRELEHELRERLQFPPIHYKHVKAHSNVKDGRSFANEWCDREAKRWRIIREKQLQHERMGTHKEEKNRG